MIEVLVSQLPEVYQPIFQHPELSSKVSRTCEDRLDNIVQVSSALEKFLGRPLRVLDLGCAQGFFSLSLARRGASVHGVDFLDKNIAVCEALAAENPDFDIRFTVGRIEAVLDALEQDQYDIVLGLSVFHHLVHEHGWHQINKMLMRTANQSGMLILELALREEPLYWGPSQPTDPRHLLNGIAFVREIASHSTHLAPISRPLLIASNHYWCINECTDRFDRWTHEPHIIAHGTHKDSRRYYFSKNSVLKYYKFDHSRGHINRKEFDRELAFLKNPPKGLATPKLLAHSQSEFEAFLAMEAVPGKLLLEVIRDKASFDADKVIRSTLRELAILEEEGLYHNDVRVWNVLIDRDNETHLIDFGSISNEPEDCSWPKNIFLAFFIFIHEVVTGEIDDPIILRPITINPARLPKAYEKWAAALWSSPKTEWSFRLMYKLLCAEDLSKLSNGTTEFSQLWMSSIEEAIQHQKLRCHHQNNNLVQTADNLHLQISRVTEAQEVKDAQIRRAEQSTEKLERRLQSAVDELKNLKSLLTNTSSELITLKDRLSIEQSTKETALEKIISLEQAASSYDRTHDKVKHQLLEITERILAIERDNRKSFLKHQLLKPIAVVLISVFAGLIRPLPKAIKNRVAAWASHAMPNTFQKCVALRAVTSSKELQEEEEKEEQPNKQGSDPCPPPLQSEELDEESSHLKALALKQTTPHELLADPSLASLPRPIAMESFSFQGNPMKNGRLEPVLVQDQMKESAASICFVVSIDQGNPPALERSIQSILRQTDPSWEIILCFRKDSASLAAQWLDIDWRIRCLQCDASASPPLRMIDSSKVATCRYLGLLDCGDVIDDELVKRISQAVLQDPDIDVIYTDEASFAPSGEIHHSFFKPDWSPEHQYSVNLMGRFLAIRKPLLLNQVFQSTDSVYADEYLLNLIISDRASKIAHIEEVMYVRERDSGYSIGGKLPTHALEPARTALQAILEKIDTNVRVITHLAERALEVQWSIPPHTPVTLLILTAAHERQVDGRGTFVLVTNFVKSIIAKSTYENYKILVVDDGYLPDDLKKLLSNHGHNFASFEKSGEFSFAEKSNFATSLVKEGVAILLNDDLEIISPDWIQALVSLALRPNVGVVGCKLLFPNDLIQHAGISTGLNGSAGHVFMNHPSDGSEYGSYASVTRNCGAVTGAVMAYRKDVFDLLGGFDEFFRVDYNDIDFCLRCEQFGLRVVYTPYAKMYHFHNSSFKRKHDNEVERSEFLNRWKSKIDRDPYYGPHLKSICEERAPLA